MATVTMPPEALDTFPKILDWNAKNRGAVASSREKEYGIWQSYTWAEQREEIRALALGLKSLGLNKGDRVSIVGSNRPRLYWAMVAIQSCGAIPVPVYQDSVAEEMQYVLEHAGSRMVFCENQEQVDKVQSVLDRLPAVEQLIYCDPRGMRRYDHTALHSFTDLQERGRAAKGALEGELEAIIADGGPDDVCVMLYTSGTTGKPKGVVLSNRNIVFAGRSSTEFDSLTTEDSVLAYLPMAWVGDFIFSIGQSYIAGFAVSCPENEGTMMADLREIGPSYFFAPPRIFENLLTTITIRMEDASPFKQRLYKKYMDHAAKVGADILDGKPVSAGDKLKYQMGELLIYGPLKDSLGMSNVRLAYTAGEAIGPEIFAFYRSLGINLKQLYGQTEASVFVTSQTDGDIRTDTVGPAWPGVELKIDDNGEVWYRSPGVFVEYYKMPEKTAETKDAEGWVATGDAGFIEEGTNHLRIIDRAKDVGKMADGSMFAPKYVENKLKFFPNILEAVLIGAGRDYCTAFLNIDFNAVGNWAERNQVAYSSYQELAGHPKVYEMMQGHVEEVNRAIADDPMLAGCQIHRFLVLHKQLDADDGELTRTQKVRRSLVNDKYKVLIDALYDGSDSVFAETEVTYEDGRKGSISATLEIRDAQVATKGKAAA